METELAVPPFEAFSLAARNEDTGRGNDTIFSLKISVIVVVFVLTMLGSYVPWMISPIFRKPWLIIAVVNILTAAAAGVIIGGAFSHLLPEATEAWTDYFDKAGPRGLASADDVDYPFAPLIAIATLFALLYVDKCLISRGLGHSHNDGQGHSHMAVQMPDDVKERHKKKKKNKKKNKKNKKGVSDIDDDNNELGDIEMGDIKSIITTANRSRSASECSEKCHNIDEVCHDDSCSEDACHEECLSDHSCHSDSCSESDACHGDKCDVVVIFEADDCCKHTATSVTESIIAIDDEAIIPSAVDCEGPKQDDDKKDEETLCNNDADEELVKKKEADEKAAKDLIKRGSRAQIGRAWVFFIALSVHSIFDGLGVGSESSSGKFYALLIAVLAHKFLDGLVLGISVYFANFRWYIALAGFVFCASMTPIGIGVSLGVVSALEGAPALACKAVFLSMTAGSFLFISLIELLPAALEDGKLTFWKITAAFIGWGIMALIALWV